MLSGGNNEGPYDHSGEEDIARPFPESIPDVCWHAVFSRISDLRHLKAYALCAAALVVLLLGKFLLPLFLYDLPLGYDPGIYRYLFLTYAESLKSFSLPELAPWAQDYPPGLFLFISPLVALGVPVDMFIGWVWNVFAVFLILVLAAITAKRSEPATGIAILLIALLSGPYYDGFYAMYWKTFASLLFVILTYHLAERTSFGFPVAAFFAVLIHQQTGLILALALGIWWLLRLPTKWKDRKFRMMTVALAGIAGAAALWYIPHFERAIWSPLKSIFLLRGENAPPGSFPETSFYLKTGGILLLLGAVGYVRSFRSERGSLWQISVAVCVLFIAMRLVFYRRFFLQLDFFLMPFAASAVVELWGSSRNVLYRSLIVLVLGAQLVVAWQVMMLRSPRLSSGDLALIEQVEQLIPKDASVIALENISGTWLLGWLPRHRVGAPGLFDYPGWTYEEWTSFIDGTNEDRRKLLDTLEQPAYFFLTDSFTRYYGERAQKVLRDPCLKRIKDAPLLLSKCSQSRPERPL